MIAVSLNVGGGVRLIKPAKLCMCTQTLQTQRGRTHGAGCVRQWFHTAEPLGERRYENWYTHTHTHSYCIFHNYFYSQDDIVTMAILRLQICKRTRDTMVLSSGRNHRHSNKHPCCNKHPPRFWSQKWKIFNCLQKKIAPNK